jgi:outer membrane immunogenic protein
MMTMKTRVLSLLASAAALAIVTSSASAADLPAQTAPPPPIDSVPLFTWTGFYVGVNAGWGWRNGDNETVFLSPGAGTPGLAGTLNFPGGDDGGFTGGGQIGYNYQMGSFVLGVETDIQWADTGNDSGVVFIPATGFVGTFVPGEFRSNAPDWFGTLRARVGVAIDRVLIYGTGGLAYTEDNTGWVLGGGVEWALPTNWNMFGTSAVTFGLEGLWLNIDRDNDFAGPIGTFTPVGLPQVAVFAPRTGNNDNEFGVVRAKLNFKFGTY